MSILVVSTYLMGMYIHRITVLPIIGMLLDMFLFLDMVDLYWRRKNTGSEMYAKHALERAMSLDVKEMGSVWAIFNRHLLVLFNC